MSASHHALALAEVHCPGVDTPDASTETTAGFELAMVRRGVMSREYRDETVLMRPGSLMVFERGQPYRISHPIPGGDRCAVLAIPRALTFEVAPRVAEGAPTALPRSHAILDSRAWLAMRVAVEAARRGDTLGGEERLVRLLPTLLRRLEAPVTGVPTLLTQSRRPRAIELTAHVLDIISRRSSDDLSLRSIATAVNTSPFHLSRLVHAVAGSPIHRLLVMYRLQEGVERILQGEDNLSRLAIDIGFSSHSHFTASFRTTFGVTPRAFRASVPFLRLRSVRAARTRVRHQLPRWAP